MANTSIYSAFEKMWQIISRKFNKIDTTLAAKSDATHTHGEATASESGLMPSSDKKFVDMLKPTTVDIGGKTIPEIQEVFNNWLSTIVNTPGAKAVFSATTALIDYWNSGDTTNTVPGGQQWMLEVESHYYLSDYVLLKLTTYSNKYVYYVARVNKVWQKIYQVSFTDHTHSVATVDARGFMSKEDKAYVDNLKAVSLGRVEATTIPEFREMILAWLRTVQTQPGAKAYFVTGNTYIDLWNTENTTSTLSGGSQWVIELISVNGYTSYAQFKLTTYTDKQVYYVALQNGTWSKIRQVSFEGHNHNSSYDTKGAADTALASAKSYTDTKIAAIPAAPTLSTENWTFTLEDGSTVTKAVYVG